MESSRPSVTIIGTGALGSTLQKFFREHKYVIRSTWNSHGGLVCPVESDEFYQVHSLIPKDDAEIGNLVFITTPDDLISEVAKYLSERPISWNERTVVHCSGNLTSDELNLLSGKGAVIVSMHPIQTFKKGDGSERFKNITISLQGDEKARKQLAPIIREMQAKPLLLDKKQKRSLHIAAVMASNYLVALMFSVEQLLREAQIEEGFEALKSLIDQTIANIYDKGPAHALTGPISRGDSESVETHLHELKGTEQEEMYRILGLEALNIAEKSGKLSKDSLNQLRKNLES